MKVKFQIMLVILFLSLNVSFPAERQKAYWRGRIEKGDGFILVKNPKNPIFSEDICDLKEDLSLGGINEAREKYVFSNIKEIDADENGNLYVLDVSRKEIRVFDKDGNYFDSIGRIGQGPGEFQWPWSLFVLKQRLIVVDLMRRSLLFYSLDGKFDRIISTVSYGPCVKVAVNSKNEIIAEVHIKGGGSGFALKKFNPEFEEVDTIALKKRERIPLLQELSPNIVWCLDSEGRIVWGDSAKYEINICDTQGKLIQRITKEHESLEIKKSEYGDRIKIVYGGRPIPPDFEQELPKFYPAFRSIGVDEMGRIFVETFEKSKRGDNYYDVFDRQGRYFAKLPMSSVYQVWKNSRLYTIEIDREKNQLIKRYKVNWKMQ